MQPPRRPETHTVEQVAARFDVKPRTVYRWRREGLIDATRVGNYLVFSDTEVDRFDRDRFAGLDVAS
jgi:excisionase family DNA binding protein